MCLSTGEVNENTLRDTVEYSAGSRKEGTRSHILIRKDLGFIHAAFVGFTLCARLSSRLHNKTKFLG